MRKKIIILLILGIFTLIEVPTIFPRKNVTVAILIHDQRTKKIAPGFKDALSNNISPYYDIDLSVVEWKVTEEIIGRIDRERDHYLKPVMRNKRYDFFFIAKTLGENYEFEAWSNKFFTNSFFIPVRLLSDESEFLQVAVNSLLSIMEYSENSLYENRCSNISITKEEEYSLLESFDLKFQKFRERASTVFKMGEGIDMIAESLIKTPPQRVLIELDIPIVRKGNILYVIVKETENLNIDRHMIQGQEFLFDPDNSKMLLLLDIPLIYIMDGHVTFDLEILGLNSSRNRTTKINKVISFNWLPQLKNEPGQVGFRYETLCKGKDRLIEYNVLRNFAREELRKTRIFQFNLNKNKQYYNLIEDFCN